MNNIKSKSFIIDCESLDTTLKSLSTGFNCKTRSLSDFLFDNNINQIFEDNFDVINETHYPTYLFDQIVNEFGKPSKLTGINWFHLTRTIKGNNFNNGLLPLNSVINSIWDMIISVVDDNGIEKDILDMKKNGFDSFHYNSKVNGKDHWGPYAMLVKDTSKNAKLHANYDYLKMPEIIKDICSAYNGKSKNHLLNILEKALVPTIVKFFSDRYLKNSCINTALCYVDSNICRNEIDRNSVAYYDGNGKPVSGDNILKVEHLL